MSSMPAARKASTAYAISGRLQTGTIGLGSVLVMGRSRVPRPAARIIDLTSERVRWEDHVLRQIGARPSRLPVKIGVRLADAVLDVHAEVGGDGADDVHRSLDLEVIADRGAVEDDLDVAD